MFMRRQQESIIKTLFDNMYFCVTSNLPTIIAGDFNTLDQPDIDRSSPGSPSEKNKALTSLWKSNGPQNLFWKFIGPQTSKVENHGGRGLKRRLYQTPQIVK